MFNLKSYFNYNKSERNGILYLLGFIIVMQIVYVFVDFSSFNNEEFESKELSEFYRKSDSIFNEKSSNKIEIKPFNPNYITDFKGYQLGMSTEEIDKLLAYRKTGKFINSAQQFKEVTGVSDSLFGVIKVYFKFPDWVSSSGNAIKSNNKSNSKQLIVTSDLNTTTSSDLKKIRGIGDVLAERIIKYREKLQGFSSIDQLNEVYGLEQEVINRIIESFEITTPPNIKKINVNTASFKEILSIVYIDYELTKKIVNYRREVAEIQDIEELKKIEDFPLEKFDRITLYLTAY